MIQPCADSLPMTRIGLMLACVLFGGQVLWSAQGGERLENATAGIALTKPPGWQIASLEAVQENRGRVRLADAELQQALQTRATAPLFVFTKHQEPYPALNPSIQITMRPSGSLAGMAPTALLKTAVTAMQRALPDFKYLTPIRATRVSGWPAATLRATYTLNTASGSHPVVTRIWLVPRGAFMFLIGMSGPPDGPDVSEAEFTQTLASIEIQK